MDVTPAPAPLIEVRNLGVQFRGRRGRVLQAVDGLGFRIEPQETLGLVGESGCGKSVTALAIMGLIPSPPGRLSGGEILFRHKGRLGNQRRDTYIFHHRLKIRICNDLLRFRHQRELSEIDQPPVEDPLDQLLHKILFGS